MQIPEIRVGTEGQSWRYPKPDEKNLAGGPVTPIVLMLPWGGDVTNDWWPNLGVWQHLNADRVKHTVAPPEGEWGHEHHHRCVYV